MVVLLLVSAGIPRASTSSHHLHLPFRSLLHSNNSSSITKERLELTPPPPKKRICCCWGSRKCTAAPALLAAAIIFTATTVPSPETLSNVPETLSAGEDGKQARIQRPKSRKAEGCTSKCVATCIRASPGEDPLNVRRPIVVFKQGFRSRQYCLVECSDICNLIKDGEDGP